MIDMTELHKEQKVDEVSHVLGQIRVLRWLGLCLVDFYDMGSRAWNLIPSDVCSVMQSEKFKALRMPTQNDDKPRGSNFLEPRSRRRHRTFLVSIKSGC